MATQPRGIGSLRASSSLGLNRLSTFSRGGSSPLEPLGRSSLRSILGFSRASVDTTSEPTVEPVAAPAVQPIAPSSPVDSAPDHAGTVSPTKSATPAERPASPVTPVASSTEPASIENANPANAVEEIVTASVQEDASLPIGTVPAAVQDASVPGDAAVVVASSAPAASLALSYTDSAYSNDSLDAPVTPDKILALPLGTPDVTFALPHTISKDAPLDVQNNSSTIISPPEQTLTAVSAADEAAAPVEEFIATSEEAPTPVSTVVDSVSTKDLPAVPATEPIVAVDDAGIEANADAAANATTIVPVIESTAPAIPVRKALAIDTTFIDSNLEAPVTPGKLLALPQKVLTTPVLSACSVPASPVPAGASFLTLTSDSTTQGIVVDQDEDVTAAVSEATPEHAEDAFPLETPITASSSSSFASPAETEIHDSFSSASSVSSVADSDIVAPEKPHAKKTIEPIVWPVIYEDDFDAPVSSLVAKDFDLQEVMQLDFSWTIPQISQGMKDATELAAEKEAVNALTRGSPRARRLADAAQLLLLAI
ncbi:hypothetical protein QBC42DRAFT_283767 [Cladorrhinum samala]|uniref:Uncharacterized protein n=1 Tax=Cladorrhinum samala TaxID=585594 RepID=A0AAV9HWL3_9PEZI|nr:hypothetical protein QBC42DRAFT_283767 [Cladorrhinum samala]